MANPFPGMNPYLEDPQAWRTFHTYFIVAISIELGRSLPPDFVSTVEERVYLSVPGQSIVPDVTVSHKERPPLPLPPISPARSVATLTADAPFVISFFEEQITEKYLVIRKAQSAGEIVAVIEVLSPTNKSREAYGREAYLKKRDQILQSNTHLLEIDLLREGTHSVAVPRNIVEREAGAQWQYLACLHVGNQTNVYALWPVALPSRLPRVSVPLTDGYADVILDLQNCLEWVYEIGQYDRVINYQQEPVPPLSPEDATWANNLLKEAGLR